VKQRSRIRRIKARTYPNHIYLARQRRMWAKVRQAGRSLSEAMREAYAKAREEREVSEMREGQQEPSA